MIENPVVVGIYLHESFDNSRLAAKTLHFILYEWMNNSDIDSVNQLYTDIDFDKVSLMVLITLLRKSSVYKKEIPRWSECIFSAYEKCKKLHINPRKELYGLI